MAKNNRKPDNFQWGVHLHEKGGDLHAMPYHHNLDEYLHAYIEIAQLTEGKSPLFRTMQGRTGQLSGQQMTQLDAYRMIRRLRSRQLLYEHEPHGLLTKFLCIPLSR